VRQSLPTLIDVMKVSDVMQALHNAHLNASTSMLELEIWRNAQNAIIKSTAPIRNWRKKGSSPMHDEGFFDSFLNRMEDDPHFSTKSIFIPIPWKRIVEEGPRGQVGEKSYWGLNKAYEVLMSLNPKFTYFTVMSQSHVGQVITVGGDRFKAVKWNNILVFDTRGMDNSHFKYPRLPIPLLRRKDNIKISNSWPQKQKQVFFAGSCHCFSDPSLCSKLSRAQMGPGKVVSPGKLPNETYNWKIHACDDIVPQEQFQTSLQHSTWTITPAGTMPTSFMMYEALQAGCLDILPWYKPQGSVDKFVWLPYHDIGVQWQHGIAEIIEVKQLKSLKNTIENISEEEVSQRQKMLRHVQPLFFAEGVNAYITYMVQLINEAQVIWRSFGLEETHLGRTVTMLQRNKRRQVLF